MLDSQQTLQKEILSEQSKNNQLANQQLQNVKDIQVCLGEQTDKIIKEKSSELMDSLKPNVEAARRLIDNLSGDISTKTMGINTKLITIDNELTNIHIGKAIAEYVVIGLICLGIGIFATLGITQKCYGKMIVKAYKTELEIAKEDGIKEYKSELVDEKSGIMEIKELEKAYVEKHKGNYSKPDEYLKSLTEIITHYKEIF